MVNIILSINEKKNLMKTSVTLADILIMFVEPDLFSYSVVIINYVIFAWYVNVL